MPVVHFITLDGTTQEVEVSGGTSLMQAAKDNEIEGIEGECGGACACATCHCYLEEGWADRVDPPSSMEQGMLECVIDPEPNSRLGCQIPMNDALDGITVRIPKSQY